MARVQVWELGQVAGLCVRRRAGELFFAAAHFSILSPLLVPSSSSVRSWMTHDKHHPHPHVRFVCDVTCAVPLSETVGVDLGVGVKCLEVEFE